ncbi:DUF4252 domain-containing protein [Puteibacter caeruleilacunae]|nr:DUF4252 domain-containing protein [Puteibacter caeruleilacunae]
MKKIIILIIAILPLVGLAQNSPIDKLFDKYAGTDGITSVNISGKLLSLAAQFESEDKEAQDLMQSISGIRILAVDNEELNKELNFYKDLEKANFFKDAKGKYELLMDVNEANDKVKFFIRENSNGRMSELLLIVGGSDNALISIRGNISMESIAKLGNGMNISGLEHLKKLENEEQEEKEEKAQKEE